MTSRGLGIGILSGFTAALCCIGPAIIVLLGLGPLLGITGACFVRYRLTFVVAGVLVFILGIYLTLNRKEGTCNVKSVNRNKKMIILSLLVMVVVYLFLMFQVLPYLQQNFSSELLACSIG